MNIVLLGASGLVGRGVLLEALDDPAVTHVLTVGRTQPPETHAKLQKLAHADLHNATSIQDQLRGYDACAFCVGVSAIGMSEADYSRVTYDMTVAFANVFLAASPGSAFLYVTGQGTDSTEKGGMMWARVKGRTENALLAMPFRTAVMFRPGTSTTLLGQAMIEVIESPPTDRLLGNAEINSLGQRRLKRRMAV